MSAMIARYLKDFSAPKLPAVTEAMDDAMFDFPSFAEVEPTVDAEAVREAAHAEGREEALREAQAAHAEDLAQEQARHAAELQALKAHFEGEMVALMAARLAEMAQNVAQEVAAATAKAIAPLMGEAVARRAIVDLAAMLRATIEEGGVARAKVKGPEEACLQLAAALGEDKAKLVEFETGEDMDLTVEAGSSVLVTRLSAFASELERVMA